ncbi:MAG: hypothetical protein KC636_33945, partial [Myxococcales bacterium]|nr:hypothetical protein [Myxococcales bacterium]
GKSNIVDAMRWCLGEQRARHLRGSGMQDVVFSGTEKRGPGGMAEVTITFENRGNTPAAYLDFPEIAVTRRLYRDGTSEYLLNKVPCRLRDISELMTGTGAGTRGYSIIEQGQVGKLVTSKPEERRHFIDEAAGITKFKTQKQAAERKIAQTGQNLLRVSDVIGELEGRLGTLRRQAQKATRYRRYRAELRDVELWTASHRYLELDMTGRVLERREADVREQVVALRAALDTHEVRISAGRLEYTQAEQLLSACQQRVYDLENRLRLIETENDFRRREQESLRQTITQARTESTLVSENLEGAERELDEVRERYQEVAGEGGPEAETAERLGKEHAAIQATLRETGAGRDRARSELSRAEAQSARLEAQVASSADGIAQVDARISELQAAAERSGGALEEARGKLQGAREALRAAEEVVAALARTRSGHDAERVDLRQRIRASEAQLDTLRGELSRARSRLQSLEEIQKRYRGCKSGVQVVMEHRARLAATADGGVAVEGGEEVVFGIMADYITAPAHLEAAVSSVLGDRLQGIVVDSPVAGARGVELLKEVQEGRTSFLPRTCREAPQRALARPPRIHDDEGASQPVGWSAPGQSSGALEVVDLTAEGVGEVWTPGEPKRPRRESGDPLQRPGVLGRLADLVDVPDDLRPLASVLFGDAVVVDRLARALELWQERAVDATIVTTDGDRVEPSGVVIGGSSNALDAALLHQKREIRELTTVAATLGDEFDDLRARHNALVERLSEVEAAREAGEQEVLAGERERVRCAQEQKALERSIVDLEDRTTTGAREVATLTEARARRIAQRESIGDELAALGERLPTLREEIEEAGHKIGSLTGERERLAEQLTEARVALARRQQQRDALKAAKDRLERQVTSERERARRLEQVASEAEAKTAALADQVTEAAAERERLLDEHKVASAEVHDAREGFDAVRLQVEELELSIRNLRREYDEQREQLQDVELGLKELRLERDHLLEDVQERYDDQLVELLIDFHDRPRVGPDERERQKELKRILGRMGEVNLTAIDEYEEVKARYEYLSGQKQDLEEAIARLQDAIDKINKTTRERFAETFTKVDAMFQQIFPRLFNGGSACLKLTDPSDILSTGVEIIAQPPGKQVRSLELLSGGEKALTATSLVFAIFLIKPSPFCLLDEVDAPLDEANVARFCKMVAEMSQTTQFIVITHNKTTMEMADRLFGVTMEERGVSKLVSVNMRRAVELANAS